MAHYKTTNTVYNGAAYQWP